MCVKKTFQESLFSKLLEILGSPLVWIFLIKQRIANIITRMVNAVVLYDGSNWLQTMLVGLLQPGDAVAVKLGEDVPVVAPELVIIAAVDDPTVYQDQFTVVRVAPPNAAAEVYIEVLHLRGFTAVMLAEYAVEYASGEIGEGNYIFPKLTAEEAHKLVSRYDGLAQLEKLLSSGQAALDIARGQINAGKVLMISTGEDSAMSELYVVHGEVPPSWEIVIDNRAVVYITFDVEAWEPVFRFCSKKPMGDILASIGLEDRPTIRGSELSPETRTKLQSLFKGE